MVVYFYLYTEGYINMNYEQLKSVAIQLGSITVEDCRRYTLLELVYKIANKVNEIIETWIKVETDLLKNYEDLEHRVDDKIRSQNEKIKWMLEEGLLESVVNVFNEWQIDGTFDRLINHTALKTVNDRINETNTQLSEIASKGTTVEVLERATKEEIDRQIADGTLAYLMIEDDSITINKLKKELVADIYDTYSNSVTIQETFEKAYVASSNHSKYDEGALVESDMYLLSNMICFKKGCEIKFSANVSTNVCALSKFSEKGSFIETVFIGSGELKTYSYTIKDEYEYLRFCTKVSNPIDSIILNSATNLYKNEIYDELSKINKIINFENLNEVLKLEIIDGFVTSENHASGAGNLNTSSTYMCTEIFSLHKGEKIEIQALTSANALVLAEYDSSKMFLKSLIVGDETTKYHVYTAIKDVEYLRVSSKANIQIVVTKIASNKILEKVSEINRNNFATISANSIRKPVINFIFDDGVLTNDEIFYNVFKNKGLVCGFALPTNINTTRFQSYLEFQANGFEILSHSTDSSAMSDGTEDVEVIEEKMKSSKEFLEQKGFVITGWVTPSSTLNDKYLSVLRKYYEYAYTVYLGTWKSNLEQYPYNVFKEDTCKLKRVSLEGSTTENVLLAIDEVCANGGILSFYAHGYRGKLTEETLIQILDYVNKKVDNNECLVMSPTNCYNHYFTLRHNDLIGII